jgi:FkbM family methyltransferase
MGFLDFLQARPRGFRAEARPDGLAPYPFWVHARETEARLTRDVVRDGTFEPFETLLVRRLLPHLSVFLDLSAGVGWYTALAQRVMKPGSEIHAFEPDRQNFGLLKLNTSDTRRVATHLTRTAVSDEVGSTRLYLSPSEFGEHSLYASESSRRSISAPVTTLDAHFANLSVAPFLAKMDTKGNEPRIFRGASSVLSARSRESAYILEFWPNGVLGAGENVEAFASSFSGFAQEPFVIYHETGGLRPITWDELGGRTKTGVATMRQYSLDILMVTPGTPAYFAVSDLITGI